MCVLDKHPGAELRICSHTSLGCMVGLLHAGDVTSTFGDIGFLSSGGDRDGVFPTRLLWSRIGHDSLPQGTSVMALAWFVIYKGPHLDMGSQTKGTAEVRAGGRVASVRESLATPSPQPSWSSWEKSISVKGQTAQRPWSH